MAQLVNSGSGNFTAASTWNTVDTVSFLDSETGTSNSTTTFVNSSQFTPGAITIDGIGLKINTRSTSPSGTFSVRLVTGGGIAGTTTGTAVAGSTVTVNVADIATNPVGWYFFKFSSPITLLAATAYNLQVSSSTTLQLTIYRDGTGSNWARFLRTTTTQAPAAADTLIVVGDMLSAGSSTTQTVTMNNTAATTFGRIDLGGKGVLSYGTAASTAYQLRLAGNLDIGTGALQMGTAGTPIPATSSAALEFVVGSNVQYGVRVRGDGTIISYGATKTGRAYLDANASAAATSLTSDIATGWLSGDRVVVASTTRTVAETEQVTLSADAVGTTLSCSALAFAHLGTSPTKAELANLTRNVKIFGQSTTLQTYILLANTNHTVSINYTELYFLGSSTGNSRGVDLNTVTGTFSASGCAFRNFEATGSIGININGTTSANITISDCVFYRMHTAAINTAQTTSSSISITNCWGFTTTAANTIFSISMNSGTFSDIVAVSATGAGHGISFSGSDMASNLIMSNLTAHSNGTSGVTFVNVTAVDSTKPTVTNCVAWRNNSRGLSLTNVVGFNFQGVTAFGNTSSGVVLLGSTLCADNMFSGLTLNAGTTLTQPVGVELNGHTVKTFIEDSTFGATTTHATGDISVAAARSFCQVYFRNCLFSSTEIANQTTNLLPDSFIGSMSHDQVVGDSRAWTRSGVITKDSTLYDTTSSGTASLRLTPNNANLKLKSPDKKVIVPSGKSLKVSVKMRWSSTIFGDAQNYNGNPTRLWVKKNPAVGINSDTLLATLTTSPVNPYGQFVRVSGTTAAAIDSGELCFYVDCDGTTGWVNVDTWMVEVI